MKYVPFSKAKPLADIPQSGYNCYIGYNTGPPVGQARESPTLVADVANVATLDEHGSETLMAYLTVLDGPVVLNTPGLPPAPYRVAPCEAWRARGLHGRAWAAWWDAVARQRNHMATLHR